MVGENEERATAWQSRWLEKWKVTGSSIHILREFEF
jgi:hypothetical protein